MGISLADYQPLLIGLLLLLTRVITLKILTDETQQIITQSFARCALKTSLNLRLNPPEGEDQPQDLRSEEFVYGRSHSDGSEEVPPMSIINLVTFWGELYCFLWMRMGKENGLPSLTMSKTWLTLKSRENQLRFKLKVDGELRGHSGYWTN